MLCPACLLFSTETEAVTVVQGTQLCRQHGLEALHNQTVMRGRRDTGSMMLPFQPPADPPAP